MTYQTRLSIMLVGAVALGSSGCLEPTAPATLTQSGADSGTTTVGSGAADGSATLGDAAPNDPDAPPSADAISPDAVPTTDAPVTPQDTTSPADTQPADAPRPDAVGPPDIPVVGDGSGGSDSSGGSDNGGGAGDTDAGGVGKPDAAADVTQDLVPVVTCASMLEDCQPGTQDLCSLIDGTPCLQLLLDDYAANGCPAACSGFSIPGLESFCTAPECAAALTSADAIAGIGAVCDACVCEPECVAGQVECDGDVLRTCSDDGSGCLTFADEDCSSGGQVCDDSGLVPQCVTPNVTCAHALCEEGVALDPSCDPCVADICEADPFCCNTFQGFWDDVCVAQVPEACGLDCFPDPASCDDQYSNGSSYQLCDVFVGECAFAHNTNLLGSCGSYCADRGGECFGAVNNGSGACGYSNEGLSCNTSTYNSVICFCSAGYGDAPPCSGGESCVDGTCE